MRSSPRKKHATPAAPATVAHDVDFGHLWRQLRAAGWTPKRPTGIQTDWTYTSPKNNVLVGECAVVEYAFQSGLLVDDEDDSVEAGADDADEHVEDEHVGEEGGEGGGGDGGIDDAITRPSQIGTSVMLSQKTVDQIFGPGSDASEVELSQNAVARAFDLSQRDFHADEEQRDAAASLHLLSEASGLESDGEDERAVTPPAAPPRRHQIPAKPNADVNVLQDGESSSEYEDFSSGDESDSTAIADDDHDCGALSKAALDERENTLRAMEWTAPSAEFKTDTTPYPGLGAEEARPVGELLDVWRSPLLTLFYFVPKSLWVSITTETNRYSLQQMNKRAEKMAARQSGRQRETATQIARRLTATQAYGAHEILHVVGLLVARMLCPQKRRFAAHWTMVEDGAIPAGLCGRYMSSDRCNSILSDLHFVDNTVDHDCDKLWKLRPVVDKIQERFLSVRTNSSLYRNQSRLEVYVGKRDGVDNGIDFKAGAAAVVRNLSAAFTPESRRKWHVVVVNRSYSSVLLAVELLKMNVYVVGTIQTNRLGFNKAIRSDHKTRPARIPRGSFLFSRSVVIPTMISYLWWERKPVYYLCTGSAMTASTIERKVKRVGVWARCKWGALSL
ncbi:uncharacterized protein IUM83_09911 [Phytophthora cinnamomi]|uniref:uncharacterized protein n=1 Tax=Phytophthora cinnamomi TaxID=4785 RepID=UPI0035597C27|nr:hypothetical protein IUM83_09911 [Phytophthora cinnamomi]